MQRCEKTCSKIRQQASGKSEASGSFHTGSNEDRNEGSKSIINNHRSRSQTQKSVQIVGVTSIEDKIPQNPSAVDKSTNFRDPNRAKDSHSIISHDSSAAVSSVSKNKASEKSGARILSQKESGRSKNSERMSERGGNSSGETDWDPTGHDPCSSGCETTKKRERAAKKAELRQERLDDYLLNKGFSYFDDLCTCSSICLINQLRRDKFVIDILKSACLFGLGIKLCEEMDFFSIIG